MSNKTIFENSHVKVTNEFLQIDDEQCQISDISCPSHEVFRDWKGAFANAGILLVIIYIVINVVTEIFSFVISFLFMAICIINLRNIYIGDHWLVVFKKTGGKNITCQGTTESVDKIIAAIGHAMANQAEKENSDNLDLVKAALEKRIDVDARIKEDEPTPLIFAAKTGYITAVKELLEMGADINAEYGGGCTALMEAASLGRTEIVKALLEKGADVNAKDSTGGTALMTAAFFGYDENIIKLLLEKGADVGAKNEDGKTALTMAEKQGHTAIVQLLKNAGVHKKL